MRTISQSSVAFHGLIHEISKALELWSPGDLNTELQYRNSLLAYFREAAPKAMLIPEYRHNGTTADLYLKWQGLVSSAEVFFELKRNLVSKSEYNRLVGQIEDIGPGSNRIVVVLCGHSSKTWVSKLKHKYSRHLDEDILAFSDAGAMLLCVKGGLLETE